MLRSIIKKIFAAEFGLYFLLGALFLFPSLFSGALYNFFPRSVSQPFVLYIVLSFISFLVAADFVVRHRKKYTQIEIQKHKNLIEIGETASQVLHDLKSPLAAMDTVIKLVDASKDESNFDVQQANDLLRRSSMRFHNIIGDLLFRFKGSSEEIVEIDLDKLLRDTVSDFKVLPQAAEINFDLELQDGIKISARKNRIERVFANIIKNAIEAMSLKGDIEISVADEERFAIVEISDSGPGMKQDLIDKVLRGEGKSSKKHGHGIGLGYVLDVVVKHKGKMDIFAVEGQGTTFQFTFPKVQALGVDFDIQEDKEFDHVQTKVQVNYSEKKQQEVLH